jgi:threonine/homoserine/homoserine lactone efflux protein
VPDTAILLPFLMTAVILEVTPGPNMVWLALLSATAGRVAGLAAVAGIALGLALQAVLAAFGVAAAIAAWPALYAVLHLAGVGYLVWLGWESWRDAGNPAHHLPNGGETGPEGFHRGLVSNILNPKAAVFFVTVLPGFLQPGDGIAETLTLSALYLVVATLVHGGIVAMAGGLRGWLADPVVSVRMHRLQAFSMIVVALWLFLRG